MQLKHDLLLSPHEKTNTMMLDNIAHELLLLNKTMFDIKTALQLIALKLKDHG